MHGGPIIVTVDGGTDCYYLSDGDDVDDEVYEGDSVQAALVTVKQGNEE